MPSLGAPPGIAPAAAEPAELGTGPPGGQNNTLLCTRVLILERYSLVIIIGRFRNSSVWHNTSISGV